MPGGVTIDNLGDLLNVTLPVLPRTYSETMRQTDYPLVRLFFTQFKRSFSGGKFYEKRVRARARSTFSFVNMYESTPALQQDLMIVQGTRWIHWQEKMPFDEREVDINSNPAQIIELMAERRSGSYESIMNGLEDDLANVRQNAGDSKHLDGLAWWFRTLAINAENPEGGFDGVTAYFRDGSSTTIHTTGYDADRANVNNARLRNFVGTYSGQADKPFFDLLRRAITRTNFGTLVQFEGEKPAASTPSGMFILADHDMNDQIVERINKGPDDQMGDLERFTEAKFAGVRFVRVPTLSDYAYRPVYGVKRSKTMGIVLKNRWMREMKALNSQATPETWVVPIVGTCNLTCDDVRSGGFVLHTKRTAA
jgi:hypothetical protein